MANLCCVEKKYIEILKERGLFVQLKNYIEQATKETFDKILWPLSNLIIDNEDFKLFLYNNLAYEKLIHKFESFEDVDKVRKRYAWFVHSYMGNNKPLPDETVS